MSTDDEMVLVPRKASIEMLKAAFNTNRSEPMFKPFERVWEAMINAAPVVGLQELDELFDATMGVIEKQALRIADLERGRGEPLAYQWRRKTVNEGSQWTQWVDCMQCDYAEWIENPGPNNRGIICEVRKLYAEQPAPVAVVLPEKRTNFDYRELGDDGYIAAKEWNAAIDKVKDLNELLTTK